MITKPALPKKQELFYPYEPRYKNCVMKPWMNLPLPTTEGKLCQEWNPRTH